MIMLYFSGTGNSKYIAELFSQNMNIKCYSIEDKIDFSQLIAPEEIIGFCYPIYGSRVPRIMREFARKHREYLHKKKIIIFCTQLIFSGDGARAFIDIFPQKYFEVIYAEHFFMPNNVCNVFFLPLANDEKIKKYMKKAEQKMQIVCKNIEKRIIRKRGFNIVSRILGLFQGIFMPSLENKMLNVVYINDNCTQCCLCVSICPMNNLECQEGRILQKSNCTVCYRCINRCPQKAINIFFRGQVRRQYKGMGRF